MLKIADEFLWAGVGFILIAVVVGVTGGSATLAWSVGTGGAWMIGFGVLVPLYSRFTRLSWYLVAAAASAAAVGGAAYLLAPSDATWWLGQLGIVPVAVLWGYFGPERKREPGDRGDPWAPPGS